MQQIKIKLDEREKLELEYCKFAYDGVRINFEQCIRGFYQYDDIMLQKVIDLLTEMYRNLYKKLYDILKNHNYKNMRIESYGFSINEGILELEVR